MGVVSLHQVLESATPQVSGDELSIVVLGSGERVYGLVVERLLGERELVVQPFDSRLARSKTSVRRA